MNRKLIFAALVLSMLIVVALVSGLDDWLRHFGEWLALIVFIACGLIAVWCARQVTTPDD